MDLKPSRFEEFVLNKKCSLFISRLNKHLKDAEAVVGGSVAKGTFLKGEHDVDIFVLFNKDGNLSDELFNVLKGIFKDVETIKGSRDYFQVRLYGLNFEIVPVLRIKNAKEAKNIMDVSPMHAEWVKKHLNDKLKDDVRLLKQFCRAQNVYGAESYIKGFSGYVLEVLIIYYKGFDNLLKNAVDWKKGVIIDVAKHKSRINKSKLGPLVVIDPVDSKRNAAAALSEEKFKRFIAGCKGYLNNPRDEFFEKRRIRLKDLSDKDVVLRAVPLEGRRDVVGAKLLKTLENIGKMLKEEGYVIKESDWYWDNNVLFWFKVKSVELPPFKKHYGPPMHMKDNVEDFKLRWEGYRIMKEGDRLYVNIPRKYIKLRDFVGYIIKDDDVRKYVKGLRLMK